MQLQWVGVKILGWKVVEETQQTEKPWGASCVVGEKGASCGGSWALRNNVARDWARVAEPSGAAP